MDPGANLEKNLKERDARPTTAFERISAACEGLVFISETDAPVEPLRLHGAAEISPAAITEFLGRSGGERVEKIEVNEFFDRLTLRRDWHGEAEARAARAFAKLQQILESELDDLTVYRVGEVRVDILVLGRGLDGEIAGMRTRAVET